MRKKFQGHICGKSFNVVARFIGVKRNNLASGMQTATASCSRCPAVLAYLHIFSWFGEPCKLSFKFSNHFPDSFLCQALPISNFFPGSSGFLCPYPIPSIFKIFPGRLLPLIVTIFVSNCTCPKVLLLHLASTAYVLSRKAPPTHHHLGLYCTCNQQRNLPLTVHLSPW